MICVIAMAVAFIAVIISVIMVYRGNINFEPALMISVVLFTFLILFCGLMRVNYGYIYKDLHTEYEDIVLLLDSVDQSDNKHLGYVLFTRAEEYNEQYDAYIKDLNNPWLSWLVYDNVDDVEHIEFNWRGVK